MKYHNPIIPGFYPDPSICRVESDYYLVNSSFEYFPCIPIFHSRDLVNWTQIGHCVSESNQLQLKPGFPNSLGMYAPTIRYHNGIFYVICTNVALKDKDDGNFIVFSKDPRGAWSQPIFVDCPGIDPSLLFDDDGKVYYVGAHEEIFLAEMDVTNGRLLSKRTPIWGGTGGNNPEGPHLYKINGYYYLLIAEGGTEHGHMVTIARSKDIYGPYESCPHNPVLTNRGTRLPIKAVGHADLVEDQNGNWWAVCLGIRPISYPFRHNLGRETFLAPLSWNDDGWPEFGSDGHLHEEVETDLLPLELGSMDEQNRFTRYYIDFCRQKPDHSWNTIYNPMDGFWKSTKNGLALFACKNSIMDAKPMAWLGRRQQHHDCIVKTKLMFSPTHDGEEAGLSIYLNHRHHYEIALTMVNMKKSLIFRRQIGSLWKIENLRSYNSDYVELVIEANKQAYVFKFIDGIDDTILGSGETAYLTTEVGGVFTGNFFALYATNSNEEHKSIAHFLDFEYIVSK